MVSESQGMELRTCQLFVIACQDTHQRSDPRTLMANHIYRPDEKDPSWRPHEAVVLLPSAAVYVLQQKATVTVSTDSTFGMK